MKTILVKKLKKVFTNPRLLITYLIVKNSFLFPNDTNYLKLLHKLYTKRPLDLKNPKSFSEKLNWLKLYNRIPEYTIMVDKVKAKEWVSERIGLQYIIPTIGVWEKPEDIDFDSLPNKFVLKCNHNSGTGMFICRDKNHLDKKRVIRNLRKGLRENYYSGYREWPYRDVPRRVLAEQFMEDENGELDLVDYKFFCFNGDPFMMYISQDHSEHPTTDFFDMDFQRLPIRMKDPNSEGIVRKPEHFEEMKRLATILCKGIPHLRVDFYIVNNRVYFGELTFFHNAGFTEIHPEEWDRRIADMIKLPHNTLLGTQL